MQATAEIILQIANTSSTNDKKSILKLNGANRRLRAVLKFIYNPYFRTNISDAKLDAAPLFPGYPVPQDVEGMIEYLVAHPTGDKETCGIAKTWIHAQSTPETRWLARGLVTQDLQIGVSVVTLNAVFGNSFIPKIGCMLGTPIDKIPATKLEWPYIITEKLDGVRRILLKRGGTVKLYSRNGHEDEGLVDIIEEARHLPDNYAYDGELLAVGAFKDSIAQRQATNSIANKKGTRRGLTFNVFDMVPIDEFLSGVSCMSALRRKSLLAATLDDPSGKILADSTIEYERFRIAMSDEFDHKFIRPVPILGIAHTMEDIEPVVNALWRSGKEGVMLNSTRQSYTSKRTKTLVKMKKTETFVLRVEGFCEGNNKYDGMLGALITEYKDCYLQVGSGFTDYERYEIWENQDKYIGAVFEVEAFGESTNKQGLVSLNCPIFKRFIRIESEEAPSE